MNDADLEKLVIKPGKLEPDFDRSITQYSVVLPSSVNKINISPTTRDTDASWTVVGFGCHRTLPITPGEKKQITIEVTAEDGTTKKYIINTISMSASDAILSDIKLSLGSLSPAFSSSIFEYTVSLPWFAENLTILPEAKDKNIGGANSHVTIPLKYGPTMKILEITSPDKLCVKTYSIKLVRDRILRDINEKNHEISKEWRCPICLGVIYCPVSLKRDDSDDEKMLFCRNCIETLIRVRKMDPFEEVPLPPDCIEERMIDAERLSDTIVLCCYSHYGCDEEMALMNLGNHMKICTSKPILATEVGGFCIRKESANYTKPEIEACKMCSHGVCKDEMNVHLRQYCPAKHPNTRFNHVVQLRNWEKKLEQKASCDLADPNMDTLKAVEGNIAFQDLQIAAQRYAALIKMKPTEFTNHLKLALVLEEMFYAIDIWGNDTEESNEKEDEDDKTLDNMMDMASDSSKEEDIAALCASKGIPQDAPLSMKLKAIDEEYHSLLEQHQSTRADYVQKLYVWKSGQAINISSGKLPLDSNDDTYLGMAFLKYEDACACSPNNWLLHMHVGRHLLLQEKYEQAIMRLEAAMGLKPTSIEARFYLGLAYLKHFGKQYRQHNETMKYLQDGIDYILVKLFEEPDTELPRCSGEIFVRNSNILIPEGMLELANLLRSKGSTCDNDKRRIIGMYRQTSITCFHSINNMTHRNQIYRQLLWIVLRAQFSLGSFMMAELKKQMKITSKEKDEMRIYWDRLACLAKAFELPVNSNILTIKRKICEEAVTLCPSSSDSLSRLGDIQLAIFDHNPTSNRDSLHDAECSYRASIEFEGKPVYSHDVSTRIRDCSWWKERHPVTVSYEKSNKKTPINAKTTEKSTARSNATAKGVSARTTKTSQTKSDEKHQKQTKSTTAPGKAGTTSKAQLTVTKKPVSTSNAKKSDASISKAASAHHAKACGTSKASDKIDMTSQASKSSIHPQENHLDNSGATRHETSKDLVMNKTNFQARLGLARALSRAQNEQKTEEIVDLYRQVIDLAPQVHDAYIELGEMLAKKDAKEAVVVYSKYPFSDDLSFDDAYLHGEIVRLLMKLASYDDANLEKSMIAYATVMGLSVLDKHVAELENKFQFKILCNVYAAVNKKHVEDEEMQAFFKFKCWV